VVAGTRTCTTSRQRCMQRSTILHSFLLLHIRLCSNFTSSSSLSFTSSCSHGSGASANGIMHRRCLWLPLLRKHVSCEVALAAPAMVVCRLAAASLHLAQQHK
jgi:hypothetical protein